jgi:hypothetical protein
LRLSGEPNGDPKEYTQFCHLRGRMIIAARLEPPKVISGSEAPARTTSRRDLSFFRAAALSEVARKRKKAPTKRCGA